MTLPWGERYDSYWFECDSSPTLKLSLLPRRCIHSDKSLWFKKAIRGGTTYTMRSGRHCGDVRWIDYDYYLERRKEWIEKTGSGQSSLGHC